LSEISAIRVKLRFADLEVEFVDRVRGIQQVIEFLREVLGIQ